MVGIVKNRKVNNKNVKM